MRFKMVACGLGLLVTEVTAVPISGDAENSEFTPLENANHIFNAIYDSVRQWGSSYHHNGMSFFLATVPEDTQLYHGGSTPNPLNGLGWMAFEPEHAMVFARPKRGPHGPHGSNKEQFLLPADGSSSAGWFQTYRTAKDLRLVYVDGMSGGKSDLGTLDSQDRILFNDTITESNGRFADDQRARAVCEIAKSEWDNRIDGVLRMEAGFEIILCNPELNLHLVSSIQVTEESDTTEISGSPRPPLGPPLTRGRRPGRPGKGPGGYGPNEWVRAITSRYHGIGGGRVVLNYDYFVTAYNTSLDLFPSGAKLPRLDHIPQRYLLPIRNYVTDMVLSHTPEESGVNWQAIGDMIVNKYASFLRDLAVNRTKGTESINQGRHLQSKISTFLSPFIDRTSRNPRDQIHRCATQFVNSPAENSSLAHQVTFSISEHVCLTLVDLVHETDYDTMLATLQQLMEYLDWSIWKECNGCAGNEFCAIPIWPMGSKEDYEHPNCQKFDSAYANGNDYWGRMH
uniref:ARAD1D21186p n=1 Tax=Blastobotrys adeninivorans TaxID=409370 RepID=A0A060TG83_BLAAD